MLSTPGKLLEKSGGCNGRSSLDLGRLRQPEWTGGSTDEKSKIENRFLDFFSTCSPTTLLLLRIKAFHVDSEECKV